LEAVAESASTQMGFCSLSVALLLALEDTFVVGFSGCHQAIDDPR
jgi:hypothetical protein